MDKQDCEIKIDLVYNASISALAGRPKGLQCYNEQMKDKVEKNINTVGVKFVIVFPGNITLVSGSFLLGMFDAINQVIGIDGIKSRFELKSNNSQNLAELLYSELKRSGC